jgi:polysaccharide pyruvyl transferase WcaK-like protein
VSAAIASRPQVLLAGAFGQGNPGDEALLGAFARALPDHAAVAASTLPASTHAEHGVEAVRRDDVQALARSIASSDAVVIAGGTIFKTLHPACGRNRLALLGRTAALAAATRALRKPLALVGVGAGRLDSPLATRLTRWVVRRSDLLVLRDEESAARLAAAGAPTPFRVGADPAWSLVATPPMAPGRRPAPAGEPRVVVALSHVAGGRELADRVAAGLAPAVAAGLPVQLQPWQVDLGEGGDERLAASVNHRLGGRAEILPPPRDLRAASEGFAGARLVVALRFHALVAAAAAGVPVLAFAHEPKLEGGARRLGQPAVSPDAPPDALADGVLAALDGIPAPIAAVERERRRAEEGFRLLRVLLARGRTDEAVELHGLPLRPEEWLG